MSKCNECGKKTGMLGSYRHPVYGGKNYICGDCFTLIENSMEQWRNFVLSNSFNNEDMSNKFQNLNTSFSNINTDIRKIFATILFPGNLL